jgi:hypothetical protein
MSNFSARTLTVGMGWRTPAYGVKNDRIKAFRLWRRRTDPAQILRSERE